MGLVDAIYMGRHEGNLKQEDECWRMLQDIVRCPELVKAMTGSNCKGDCDSKLDGLSKEQREKLDHLTKLEQKGFEVGDLKKEIMDKARRVKDDIDHQFPPTFTASHATQPI